MRLRGRIANKLLALLSAIAIILIVFINFNSDKSTHDDFITVLPPVNNDVNLQPQPQEEQHKQDLLLPAQPKDINTHQLIDLTNFQYSIENKLCANYTRELLAIIIVTSYVGHDELRAAHRQAIAQSKLSEMGFQRVFLLAKVPSKEQFITQSQIISEQHKFGDLLQGDFIEAYRNLSYKHIMGLRWAALECPKAKFIIKVDDDIVYDVFQMKNYLELLEVQGYNKSFLAGYVMDKKLPKRISANKWYVSQEEYAGNAYPDYLSGWLYLTNPSTALSLVRESQRNKFFWIDDTWITGVLRDRLKVPMVRLNAWFSANSEFLDCCVRDLKDFNYECELYVGPNGGDSKLIVEFLHNVEKCYFGECVKRSPEKSLKQTCVASVKHIIPDHGEGVVRSVKLK